MTPMSPSVQRGVVGDDEYDLGISGRAIRAPTSVSRLGIGGIGCG